MGAFQDLRNIKYGKLTPVKYLGKSHWLCRCDCGKETTVQAGHLKTGHTRSCGCQLNERRDFGCNYKHGLAGTKFYRLWKRINQRCFNKNHPRYVDWGGRGITLFSEWINNPKKFCEYVESLEHAGEKGYSLDRINNDGNYEPGNIRWATNKEQSNNRRKRRKKNVTKK